MNSLQTHTLVIHGVQVFLRLLVDLAVPCYPITLAILSSSIQIIKTAVTIISSANLGCRHVLVDLWGQILQEDLAGLCFHQFLCPQHFLDFRANPINQIYCKFLII